MKNTIFPLRTPPGRAFTLLEILVSIAILAVVFTVVVGLLSAVFGVWRTGSARADNFTKARVALDVLSRDLRDGLLAGEWPAFSDQAGAAVAFLTRRRSLGTTSRRPLSTVAYRLETGAAVADKDFGLVRGSGGLGFDEVPPPLQSSDYLETSSLSYQPIGPGVIALQVQFMDEDGEFADLAAWQTDSQRLVAVHLSIAVVNERTLALLRQNHQIETLLSRLKAPPTAGETFFSVWNSKLESGELLTGLVAPTGQNLRLFQRTIPLPGRPK